MTDSDFRLMVTRHHDCLHPFAISLTRDNVEAQDLYQETMLRALTNRDKYQRGTNLKAWLYTIMRNTFINQYRRRMRFAHVGFDTVDEIPAVGLVAANGGWSGLRMAEISEAIDALPDAYRLSFELYYTGYKYAEISAMLKEPLGTIKSRIHFARRLLVASLER